MIELECVSKALRLATTAHKGQTDKGGTDYIKHPIAVAECFDDEEGQIVALLHDTIEDTEITVENLRTEGFSDAILNAICCLTKKKTNLVMITCNVLPKTRLLQKLKLLTSHTIPT